MIVCLCGKSCSGKSTLAKILADFVHGINIDIDKIGHESIENECIKKQLINVFGKTILDENMINRKKLSRIVFNSSMEMDKLTNITWPYMEKVVDNIILNNPKKTIILDYLLLPKTKFFLNSDIRVLLDIPYEIRKERAIKRDKIMEEEFLLREKATYQYNLNDFDVIIKDDNFEEVKKLIKEKIGKN